MVLFVCYGNICRSPLAEHAARAVAQDIESSSAGFHSKEGRRSPDNMVRAAASLGCDLAPHVSSSMTEETVRDADLIVLMDWRNYDLMRAQFPAALNKTVFLGLFLDPPLMEIADPFDMTADAMAKVALQIKAAVGNLMSEINGDHRAEGAGAR